MKKIEAFQCEWCAKITRTAQGMQSHERHCHNNPFFNCCENCIHGCRKCNPPDDYERSDFLDESYCEPYCKKHEQFIFGADKTDNAYFLDCDMQGYREERPMPYTCWYFESKGRHGFEIEGGENP